MILGMVRCRHLDRSHRRQAGQVIAIEIDSDLLPILQENLAEWGNIKIVEEMPQIDLDKLVEEITGQETL